MRKIMYDYPRKAEKQHKIITRKKHCDKEKNSIKKISI